MVDMTTMFPDQVAVSAGPAAVPDRQRLVSSR
jgi:hypothetical protein